MYFGPCVGHFTLLSCIVAIRQVFGLQMTTVCSPKNATGLLQCMKGQWIQILSESYIPQMSGDVVDGSSCDFNFTSQCSSVRTDMEANCNGPCPDNGCQELVDVPGVQSQVPCLFSAHHVGVLVQYECIDDSTIIDMCTGEISLQMSYPTIYLSSPKFPNTIPQNTSCVCHIQGTRLTVSALQINAQTKLPWGLTEPYSSVLTVQNNDSFLWQSSNLCKNCTSIHIQNENLYLSHATNYVNITITFSNFGLPHQLVWLQVSGQGQTMSATCSSSPLPPDRIITTTTTTTTTSTTTSATISMATSTTSSISSTITSTYTTSTVGLSSVSSSTSTISSVPSTTSSSTSTISSVPSTTSSSTSTISSVPSTTSSSTSTISSVHLPSTSTYTKSSVPFTTSISTSTPFIASFSTSTTSPTTPPTTSTKSAVHTTSTATLAPQTTSMSTTLGMSETRQSALSASSTTSRPTATSASITPPPTSAQPNSSTASDGVIGTPHTFESTSTTYIKSTTQDPAMITQNQPTLTTKDASSSLLAASNKRSDSQTLVIILVIILLVLLIIVIIVGVMVLRKRRKFTYNGKVGFKALFLSLYHQMTNRHPRERDPSKLDFHSGSFDSLELSGKDHKAGSIPEEAIYTTELKNSESMGDNPYTNSLNTQIIPSDIKMNVHATCQEKPLLTCQQPSLETPVTQRNIDNSVEMSLKLDDDSTHEKEKDKISTGKHDTPTSGTIKPDSQNNIICFDETCVNCDESMVPPLSPKVNIVTQKQSVDDKTQETVSPSNSKTFIALNKVPQLVTDQRHDQLPTHDVNRLKELDRIEDKIKEETESVKEYKRQKISKMKNKRTHNNIVDKKHASEDLHSAEFHQNDRSSFSTLDQPSIRVKQEEPPTGNSHKSLFQPQEPPSSFHQVIDKVNKISSSSSDYMGQIISSTDDKTKKKLNSRLKTGEKRTPQSRSSTPSILFSSSVHVTNNPNTLDDNTNSTKQTMSSVDITDSTPQLTPSYEDTDIIKVSHPEVKHKKTSKSQKVSDILQQSLDMIKQQRKQNEFVDRLNTSESKNLNSESQSFDSSQC